MIEMTLNRPAPYPFSGQLTTKKAKMEIALEEFGE
jgi:hypothetical protein